MTNSPKVSVIIPVHNGEAFLRETLGSVLRQIHQNWEALVVNDCSTDNSEAIIEEFCNIDSRFKLLKTASSSGGPAQPRNKGIMAAQGEYVAFLDADDVWYPEKLEIQVACAREAGADLVHCKADLINDLGSNVGSLDNSFRLKFVQTFLGTRRSYLLFNPIVLSSVLIKKSSVTKFRESPRLNGIEDWMLWIELVLSGKKIKNVEHALLSYRHHASSLSHSDAKLQYRKGFYLYSILLVEGKLGLFTFHFLHIVQLLRTFRAGIFR